MNYSNLFAWILVLFGAITFMPLCLAQLLMLFQPHGQKTKDLIIGKNKGWRDKTHFNSAIAFAWADLLVLLPLFIAGSILVIRGEFWGFVIWIALGVLSVYFSILLWVLEKKYTYKAVGWFAYFTYFWGFFLYWGLAALVFSIFALSK